MPRTEAVIAALAARGCQIPQSPKPGGSYDPVRIVGGFGSVAIQFPLVGGRVPHGGRLGAEVSTEQGVEAAAACALNVLAQLHEHVGLERVAGLLHVQAPMQVSPGWTQLPAVLDGASRMFLEALGEAGRHSRSLMGVEYLPLNAPVALIVTFGVVSV